MKLKHWIGISLLMLLTACDTKPVFPLEPEITYISINTTEVQQLESDGLILTFRYQDGDGDLGYTGDPVDHIFIRDTRPHDIPEEDRVRGFSFESITPNVRNPSIQGQLEVTFTPGFHGSFYNPFIQEDSVIYEIYLVDRAGNLSNTITTPAIRISQ